MNGMADDTKSDLRRECRAHRAARQGARSEADPERLADFFLGHVPPCPNSRIAGYWPIDAEIDVLPLLGRLNGLGYDLCLPVVVDRRRTLSFRSWRPSDQLEAAAFGTRVPLEGSPEVVPQMLIVPVIAFDNRGHRLGYGGGYYDCTLSALAATGSVSVGVAFEDQHIEKVPTEPHDMALDWIITEERARRTCPS